MRRANAWTAAALAVLAGMACHGLAPLSDPPVMTSSTASLSFEAAVDGADPAAQTVTIGNSGGGTLAPPAVSIAYGSGSGWLTATVSGDAAPYTVTVRPIIAGLPTGDRPATLEIASDGAANSPQTVNVTLTVAPPPFALGAPTTLSSMTLDNECWFAWPEHAVFTNAGGTTWIASAEHHFCDTHVDPVVVYHRTGQGTWSSEPPFSYAYSPSGNAQNWGTGMPGNISMAASSTGAPHIFVNNRKGYGTWYWGPDRGVYIRQSGDSWLVTEDVTTDEDLQEAEGNANGAQYSGYSFSIVNDPATDTLHLVGCDGAWWATRYHAVYSSVALGSSAWTALEAIYTQNGAIDRGPIQGSSQDIQGGSGLQIWFDAVECALRGRWFSGGGWGIGTGPLPLLDSSCNSDPTSYWNLCSVDSETLLAPSGAPTVIAAARPCGTPGPLTLNIFTNSAGFWSGSAKAMYWASSWRAFDDASGRLYIVHLDAAQKYLMIYDVSTGEDTAVYRTDNTIDFVDAERHDPKVIVWSESGLSQRHLKVADLVPATP
jgi:hypothetical protein